MRIREPGDYRAPEEEAATRASALDYDVFANCQWYVAVALEGRSDLPSVSRADKARAVDARYRTDRQRRIWQRDQFATTADDGLRHKPGEGERADEADGEE